MPVTAARRRDAPSIQRLSYLPQRVRIGLLCLADDRKDVLRVSVRLGLHGAQGVLAGLVEPWAVEGGLHGLCQLRAWRVRVEAYKLRGFCPLLFQVLNRPRTSGFTMLVGVPAAYATIWSKISANWNS
jgi:hypothetical protein